MPEILGRASRLADRLRAPGPLATVELRPPSTGLTGSAGMDVWIDMYHSVQRLAREERYVFLTDNAVGAAEEENLSHLVANLGSDVPRERLVPFLTCKHTLEHCLMYADRAASLGFQSLTVLGGDKNVGRARCVPHAFELRKHIRERQPSLSLGGWANPHREISEQVDYVSAREFAADFFLSQIMSHHSAGRVEAFVNALDRRGESPPGVFGVFFYRSANPGSLERLGGFFPVPAEALTAEFDAGVPAEEICARTIRALRDAGAEKIYVSNLGHRGVEALLADILARV